ncbi:MAG: insecticidal toxin complex protein TcdB family [Gemmatimonadetes bacterium]|nr:insecticidal toxin complex protein TcdB family [Gemmatimonadota bacterium]
MQTQGDPASLSGNVRASGSDDNFLVQAPSISLPKGGGAIRGIGEKFGANPVTGTGSTTIPIFASPGRLGFGPQLALSYDSGSGNGPFGLGWSIPIPSITRKTDKGLPEYRDDEESDVFILLGAEDLVPYLNHLPNGAWARESANRMANRIPYRIDRYRPRVEGSFALVERWTNTTTRECHWRTITRDNVTTLFGIAANSRVADRADSTRVFSWLIDRSFDDKGNLVVYRYKAEDYAEVDRSRTNERNRDHVSPGPARYLKHILYGNLEPYFPDLAALTETPIPEVPRVPPDPAHPSPWMFQLVFDYGEHDSAAPTPGEVGGQPWRIRTDSFSTYRAGFELRTHRLCERVLMFHHFSELGSEPCLVRATNFSYHRAGATSDPSALPFSFVQSVWQTGYVRDPLQASGYRSAVTPPVEFEYTRAQIADATREIDPASLENLPGGISGPGYQWVDLNGEGVPGVLAEQAGGWYYKPGLGNGTFGPTRIVSQKPSFAALGSGRQQLLDLEGDGELELVDFSGPVPGLQERKIDSGWRPFTPFDSLPNIDWNDPNLRFVDLTGDGHADVIITEHEVFTWYSSLGEEGFAAASRAQRSRDEEVGPHLVFGDGTHTVFTADMSGDGLNDLVRIRNGEVCYWPNVGYGRFGAKVTMDNAPCFDAPELYDPRRIRLADVDGSGPTDIIYLGPQGATLYVNRSGNALTDGHRLAFPVATENVSAVQVADLLGNGTACLVWSSTLPADTRHPVRYLDLMGGQKPHLLTRITNNLGAETTIDYAPSTKFYLADKQSGRPWITRLAFPVHCVERVTIKDKWRGSQFSTRYSYHHGYFDGVEREFRGFGRVEQVDVESFDVFEEANAESPYISDRTLYQPPVKTITWFHTGAAPDRERIVGNVEQEYFPNSLAALPHTATILTGFAEKRMAPPDLLASKVTPAEWREAMRACKGIALRREVYELDVGALEEKPDHPSKEIPVRLFSAESHGCHIQRVQPSGNNRHGVFLAVEREAISYHYELDLRAVSFPAAGVSPPETDPRVVHTLNLTFDELGNVQQAVAVGYPRRKLFADPDLASHHALIRGVQSEEHVSYTETRYTDALTAIDPASQQVPIQYYRLRVPCEVQTYELTGFMRPSGASYFSVGDFLVYDLSVRYLPSGVLEPVLRNAYHKLPQNASPTMRLVEHARMLFFSDDPTDVTTFLSAPLALGTLGKRGLLYESYKLALSDDLLDAVFSPAQLNQVIGGGGTVRQALNTETTSGYLSGSEATNAFGISAGGEYWMRSGRAGFLPHADDRFYLPDEYTDPFTNTTTLQYDARNLFVHSSTDALGNPTSVARFDYRVLAPVEMEDINENRAEACLDVLGRVAAIAVKGKALEGDNLVGFDDAAANPSLTNVLTYFDPPALTELAARAMFSPVLGNATTRLLYHFGESVDLAGRVTWQTRPAGACAITRERHVATLATGALSPLQIVFECSDGLGAVLMKRSQAEPEVALGPLRWIVSGKTILNNKGKAVKQYEPYFSSSASCCAEGDVHEEVGVTPLMYYDAVGRLVRTEMPDGTFSRVELSPWHVATFDACDTVTESVWYSSRNPTLPSAPLPFDPMTGELLVTPDQRAAWLSARHYGTPALTILDSLGREVIGVAHDRVEDPNSLGHRFGGRQYRDERHVTYTKLDAEGKPLWIRDARKNLVMQYITSPKPVRWNDEPNEAIPATSVPAYDIAGNLLFQHSMDAGDRWMINDAASKALFAWDSRDNVFVSSHDELHRPTTLSLINASFANGIVVELTQYALRTAADLAANRCGKALRVFDQSGVITNVAFDFKENSLSRTRRLALDFDRDTDWSSVPALPLTQEPNALLMAETFTQQSEYDALDRPVRQYDWHRAGQLVAVYEPSYDARGLLASEAITVGATQQGGSYTGGTKTSAIGGVTHDAKGQRLRLELGNGVVTQYEYDPATFHLTSIRSTRPGKSDLQDLKYTYDAVGNISEVFDDAIPIEYFGNALIEPRKRYTYDALYRLVEATGREHAGQITYDAGDNWNDCPFRVAYGAANRQAWRNYTQRYAYDSVGNILVMNHVTVSSAQRWTRQYEYATDSNRLLATGMGATPIDHYPVGGPTLEYRYTYDAHGSMLSLSHLPRMEWDFTDHLRYISRASGSQGTGPDGCPDTSLEAWYRYDAAKQRTRKRVDKQGGLVEERFYLGGFEWYRRTLNGILSEEIETLHLFDGAHRLLMIDQVIQTDRAVLGVRTLYRYALTNHLGSATVEVDEQAEIITCEEYHPYGTTAYQSGRNAAEVSLKRYRYTGMERDEESGLSYHGARYYLPIYTRWISTDPDGVAHRPNVYEYSVANPTTYSDTSGKAAKHAAAPSPLEFTGEERTRQIELIQQGRRAAVSADTRDRTGGVAALSGTVLGLSDLAVGIILGPLGLDEDGNYSFERQLIGIAMFTRLGLPLALAAIGKDLGEGAAELGGGENDEDASRKLVRAIGGAALLTSALGKEKAPEKSAGPKYPEMWALRDVVAFLKKEGISDPLIRAELIENGLREPISETATPKTYKRFKELVVDTFVAGKRYKGRKGDFATRVDTLNYARNAELLGFDVKFELKIDGKFADLAIFMNGKLIDAIQFVKQVNVEGPPAINPREAGPTAIIQKQLSVPVRQIVTGTQRPGIPTNTVDR